MSMKSAITSTRTLLIALIGLPVGLEDLERLGVHLIVLLTLQSPGIGHDLKSPIDEVPRER